MNQKQKNKIAKQLLVQQKIWKFGFLFLFCAIITGKKASYVKLRPALFSDEKGILKNTCIAGSAREYLLAWGYQKEKPEKAVWHLENAKIMLDSCKEKNAEREELESRILNLKDHL